MMRALTQWFSLLFIPMALLSGCAAGPASKGGAQIAGAPAWVLNPEKQGYISVVGFAPQQEWGGKSAQYRVAEMKARQELAQMIQVQVESSSRYATEVHNGNTVRSEADTETRLQSSVQLHLDQARVIEEWTDPATGMLYIWMVTHGL